MIDFTLHFILKERGWGNIVSHPCAGQDPCGCIFEEIAAGNVRVSLYEESCKVQDVKKTKLCKRLQIYLNFTIDIPLIHYKLLGTCKVGRRLGLSILLMSAQPSVSPC